MRTFWIVVKDGDTGEQAEPFELQFGDFVGDVTDLKNFVVTKTLEAFAKTTTVSEGEDSGQTH